MLGGPGRGAPKLGLVRSGEEFPLGVPHQTGPDLILERRAPGPQNQVWSGAGAFDLLGGVRDHAFFWGVKPLYSKRILRQ